MANYRVYFTYNAIEYEIFKKMGFGDSTFESKKVDGQIFYRKELNGVISFLRGDNKGAYDAIIEVFTDSTKRCDEVSVRISKTCSGVTNENYWNGLFTASQMTVNFCTCRIDVEPIVNDEYSCILNNWENDRNFYDAQRNTVSHKYDGLVNYESFLAFSFYSSSTFVDNIAVEVSLFDVDLDYLGGSPTDYVNHPLATKPTLVGNSIFTQYYWGDGQAGNPTSGVARRPLWGEVKTENNFITGNGWSTGTYWERETILIPTGTSIPNIYGPNWIFIGTHNGEDKYYRVGGSQPCKGEEDAPNLYNYGYRIGDVANVLADNCTNCIVSHFFDLGDETDRDGLIPNNTAYNGDAYKLITIHQKSGILDYSSSDPPTAASHVWNFKDFQETLRNMYNVHWFINSEGCIQFEHISYFTQEVIDLKLTDVCTIKPVDNNPYKEVFNWMDNKSSAYFNGKNIEYLYNCSNENKIEYNANNVTTDVCEMLKNPNDFDKGGFVFISSYTGFEMINSNKPNSFSELHNNLWKWNRYADTFNMNGSNTSGFSRVYLRESNPIIVEDCICDIDPNNLINTERGQAEIINMSEKISTGTIKLTLGYE